MEASLLISYLLALVVYVSIVSMAFGDNPLYRWAQHTFLAVSVATFTLLSSNIIYSSAIVPLLNGDYLMLVPIILGCLVFTNQMGEKWRWISRYPLWMAMGVGSAFAMRAIVSSQITSQIITILNHAKVASTSLGNLNNFIHIVFPIAVFSYFFFYFMHKTTAGRGLSKLGRYCIMIAFGVSFGGAMMSNTTFITYQLMWVFKLGPPKPISITYVAALITLCVIALIGYYVKKWEDRVGEKLRAS